MSEKKRKLLIKVMAITLVALMIGGAVGSAIYFMVI